MKRLRAAIKQIPGMIYLYEWIHHQIWIRMRGRNWKREQEIKATIIRRYQKDRRIFVETGTNTGDMLNRMLPHFDHLLSVEIDPKFYARARKRFRRHASIQLFYGASERQLPWMLEGVDAPAVFWLDAHGPISKPEDTPIYQELQMIVHHSPIMNKQPDHVILIDDLAMWANVIIRFAEAYDYWGLVENGIIVLKVSESQKPRSDG